MIKSIAIAITAASVVLAQSSVRTLISEKDNTEADLVVVILCSCLPEFRNEPSDSQEHQLCLQLVPNRLQSRYFVKRLHGTFD